MSKQKQKKINKLSSVQVWPHVVGTVIFFIIYAFVMAALTISLISAMIVSKVTQTGSDFERIASAVQDSPTPELYYESICIGNPKITGLIIRNGSEIVTRCGENAELDFGGPHISSKFDDNVMFDVYLAQSQDGSFLYFDENLPNDVAGLKINITKFSEGFLKWDESTGGDALFYSKDVPIINQTVWYSYYKPQSDKCVALRYDLSIGIGDFIQLIFMIGIISVFSIIVAIYHICSLVSTIKAKKKVFDAFYTDPVTGGKNWEWFEKRASKDIYKNRKGKYRYAMVHVRMEKYRSYCACYGTNEGEELIEDIYRHFMRCINGRELVVHKDFADFGLLLVFNTEDELAQRLIAMKQGLEAIRPERRLSFDMGICAVAANTDDPTELYNNAGMARSMLAEQSSTGIAWFNEELKEKQLWERRVEDDMERALQNHEFQVYLQPKYSTKEEKLSGAEALVRWIHPTEGFIPPIKFIPIFEKNGFILKLDDYMITEVARLQGKWYAEGKQLVPISVNVSRAHFTRDELAEHICSIVDSFNVPHWAIELELTESAFFDDKEVLLKTVNKMKQFGFAVSMDDFGAGYSSLNSLKELPLDVVKLDAEFFRGAQGNRGDLIVADTIALAKKLGMRIVAEGIETREQVDFLAQRECDLIQGYFFAKPMPVSDYEERAFGKPTEAPAETAAAEAPAETSTEAQSAETTAETQTVETEERKDNQ